MPVECKSKLNMLFIHFLICLQNDVKCSLDTYASAGQAQRDWSLLRRVNHEILNFLEKVVVLWQWGILWSWEILFWIDRINVHDMGLNAFLLGSQPVARGCHGIIVANYWHYPWQESVRPQIAYQVICVGNVIWWSCSFNTVCRLQMLFIRP